MMWDQGTHDPGTEWPLATANLMKKIDADGVNGDTQDATLSPLNQKTALLTKILHGIS